MNTPLPLEHMLLEINDALEAGIFWPALNATLTLPDVCAALEGQEHVNKETYVAWWDANLGGRFTHATGLDFFRLRCGIVHNASSGGHPQSQFARVIFTLPVGGLYAHDNLIRVGDQTYLNLDLHKFCHIVMEGVIQWAARKVGDPTLQENSERLIMPRPDGFPPIVKGALVIA